MYMSAVRELSSVCDTNTDSVTPPLLPKSQFVTLLTSNFTYALLSVVCVSPFVVYLQASVVPVPKFFSELEPPSTVASAIAFKYTVAFSLSCPSDAL